MTAQTAVTEPSPVTRFAPSPTGHLHKGHAYAALQAANFAKQTGGRFLLRIEDIDHTRCSPENTEQILEDLAWLGLEWEEPVRIQSEHKDEYEAAAGKLRNSGFLYPCFCTRKDILREIEEAGRAPHGSEGPLYPGTCRRLGEEERRNRIADGIPHALRLDVEKALDEVGRDLTWLDSHAGLQPVDPNALGDAILVRKDIGTSYHLAVVHDDGLQGITDIVRGVDLFDSTHLHVILQRLLGLPTPTYHHHRLLTDESGERLAKRNRSITLKSLRESGITVDELTSEFASAEDKLKTENFPMPTFHPLAKSEELEEGKGRPFELEGHRIALVRHEGTVYAIDDLCPHADASLAFGPVENGCIACPWHYAEFKLSTGEALSGPTPRGIRTYAVREEGGQVSICLDLTGSGADQETSSGEQGNS